MLNSGDKLAHFSIIRPLGEGGMGEVYLAEDSKLNRQVALKTLRDDFFDNPERRDRFEREAKTAAQITHSNVMSIYDTGVATAPDSGKEVHYIVMELVQGKPLDEWIKRHESEPGKLLRVAEAIGSGIAAAHKLNIVHRDIKSDNIIVTEDDEPKILDFGLAKPIDPLQASDKPISGETVKQELTKVGTVIGTVSYMSPEQARGETVDPRSDIFSFGVLLFKMFTGQMPFTGSSQVSILAKILESPHPRLSTLKTDVDPEIERIINKCLQKDPNDRYQDIRDLVVDLRNLRRQYDSGISQTVSQVSGARTLGDQPGARKSGSAVWKVGGVVVLLAVLAIGYLAFSNGGRDATTLAQEYTLAILSFENRTGESELDWLETGLPEILLTDLAQGQAIRLISHRRILEALGGTGKELSDYSYEEQFNAAGDLGAIHVISGSIYKQGNKFRISTQLEEVASGEVLFGENVMGSDPFNLVDSLTIRVAASLSLSEDQFSDQGVSQLTTANADAYKYYHLGLDAFLDSQYDSSRTLFERAIAEDSSFAMSYLRMGMSYMFEGKQQEALPYFSTAKEFEQHLPMRDRGLLDVYTELWLTNNLDAAFTKLESLVANFPDDAEALAIYAILQWQLKQDSAAAIQSLEQAIQIDPTFQLTQEFAYQIYDGLNMDDKALEIAREQRESHPDSPRGYDNEVQQYIQRGRIDEAIKILKVLDERFPQRESTLILLSDLYIRKRDFEEAERYLEIYRQRSGNDPYNLMTYAYAKGDLANWQGRFLDNNARRHDAIKLAKETGDSNLITSALVSMGNYQSRIGNSDSAIVYFKKSLDHVQNFGMRASVPISIVGEDPSTEDEIRPIFESAVEDFRARVPSNLFFLASAMEKMFNGLAKSDTALYIEGNREILQLGQASTSNERELGIVLILTGKYREGIEYLKPQVEGNEASSSGFHYPMLNYYLGLAHDELGEDREAVKYFEEMLRYWNEPQVIFKEIKDARERLARLRS